MNLTKSINIVAYKLDLLRFKLLEACPQKRVDVYATAGPTCNDFIGKWACELPKEMEGGTCRRNQSG